MSSQEDRSSDLTEFLELEEAVYNEFLAIAWQRIQRTTESEATKVAWQDENLIEEIYKTPIQKVEKTKERYQEQVAKKEKK